MDFSNISLKLDEATDASSDVVVETADDEDEAEPEEVVVTGSRIARTQYEVAQPVTIIYGEEYENRGVYKCRRRSF